MIQRETLPNGVLRLSADSSSYEFSRLRPGILQVRIRGRETGTLGRAPLGEVAAEAALHPPLHLFIDMTDLAHVVTPVSDDWTAWFRANKSALKKVDVLAPSTFVRLTVAVSHMFTGLGNLMQIHSDAASFEEAMKKAAG